MENTQAPLNKFMLVNPQKNAEKTLKTAAGQARSCGVIVLGMHRSGTSAIANCLTNLGFEFPGEAVPATEYNQRGHWEPRAIVEIHDDFLHALGRTWSDPRPLGAELFQGEAAAEARKRLRECIQQDFLALGQWVLKDPRMCRLMPLWREVFEDMPLELRFLHVLRSPLSVADSLLHREGFSKQKSYLLWLRHNLEAEAVTRGMERSWLHFEHFAHRSPFDLLEPFRPLTSSRISQQRLQQTINRVLDPSMVHHEHGLDKSLESLSDYPWIATAYRALVSCSTDDNSKGEAMLDDLRAEIDRTDRLQFGDPEVWEREQFGERFYWLQKEIEGFHQSVETQRREIEAQRAEVGAITQAMGQAREQREQVYQELSRYHRTLESQSLDTSLGAMGETLRSAMRDAVEHVVSEDTVGGLLADQRQLLVSLEEPLHEVIDHQVAANKEYGKMAFQLKVLKTQSKALEGLKDSLDSQNQRMGTIERLITERLENRHLTLLGKSLEATARIESRWMAVSEQLQEARSELAAARQECVVVRQERDATLVRLNATTQESDTKRGQQASALEEDQNLDALLRQALSELTGTQAQLEAVRRERDAATSEVLQIQSRASWRYTAPLRSVMKFFKRGR